MYMYICIYRPNVKTKVIKTCRRLALILDKTVRSIFCCSLKKTLSRHLALILVMIVCSIFHPLFRH